MPKKKELSFEESLERLEAIVAQMETGDLPLADLMENYTEGVKLSARCYKVLDDAEAAMDTLLKEQNGKIVEEPLVIEEEF